MRKLKWTFGLLMIIGLYGCETPRTSVIVEPPSATGKPFEQGGRKSEKKPKHRQPGRSQDEMRPSDSSSGKTSPEKPPLTEVDIEEMIKGKVPCKLIADKIAKRGVDFELSGGLKKRLKKLRSGRLVIDEINKANEGMR